MSVDPLTIIKGILTIAAALGWFSESHWPSKVDEAIDKLEALEGRELPELREKRAYAYEMYLKHHHAEPWNKPWRLEKFQRAIVDLAKAIKAEAERYAEQIGYEVPVAGITDWLKKNLKYLVLGGVALTLLLVLIAPARGPEIIYLKKP